MIAGHRVAALLSFEGPDRYASVGGLGSRETSFARALGDAGVETTLIFVGDPTLPALEGYAPGVTLRRWCQWISAFHPRDVYDGEANKVRDYTASVPQFVVDDIVVPAIGSGTRVLVIAEEWQTVGATIALDALLRERGLRDRVTMLWNANNTYGFERIDWIALQAAASVVTISKYMKFELSRIGVPALVVPNGIHDRLLDGPPRELVTLMRSSMRGKPALVKVGRFDPDKNWLQAIDAVFAHARERGLRVETVEADGDDAAAVAAALAASEAEIVQLRAFLPEATLHALYAAADAVLANSGKEPFGLVGLEVMAVGGIPVCGATGEEYAEPFVNAIVCDTNDGRELAAYLLASYGDERRADRMRQAGYATAHRYVWQNVIETLGHKVAYIASKS